MKKMHCCGFEYDDSVTIDSGGLEYNNALGCLIGVTADAAKLPNLNSYVKNGTIFLNMTTGAVKIFSKSNTTWNDL